MKETQATPTMDTLNQEQREAVSFFLALVEREQFYASKLLRVPFVLMICLSGYWLIEPHISPAANVDAVSPYLILFGLIINILGLVYLSWSHRTALAQAGLMLKALEDMGVSGSALADIIREAGRRFQGSRLNA